MVDNLTYSGSEQDREVTMILLQHSSFCAIPLSHIPNQSLKQKNQLLHQQHFPFHFPKKPKASTFRIFSLGAGFSDGITQIAHNKAPHFQIYCLYASTKSGFLSSFAFFAFFLIYLSPCFLVLYGAKVLIAAGASMLIGQISKPFTSVFLYGKDFDIKAVVQAGGFPSSHSSATVAAATFFGLERGFSDPIFGLTAVYAGLIMYDAQGVRREVGIHARTLNKRILLQMHVNSLHSKDRDTLINSQTGSSTPLNVEGLEKSLLSQEATSLEPQQVNARQLVKSRSKIKQTDEELLSSCFSADTEEISKLVADGLFPLKESVGHTEVEVIAGALLGILVGLSVYNFI